MWECSVKSQFIFYGVLFWKYEMRIQMKLISRQLYSCMNVEVLWSPEQSFFLSKSAQVLQRTQSSHQKQPAKKMLMVVLCRLEKMKRQCVINLTKFKLKALPPFLFILNNTLLMTHLQFALINIFRRTLCAHFNMLWGRKQLNKVLIQLGTIVFITQYWELFSAVVKYVFVPLVFLNVRQWRSRAMCLFMIREPVNLRTNLN